MLAGQVRQGRLGPAVAAQRVAVFGGDVGRERGGRGQVGAVVPLHGFHCASSPGQEGVTEQLAQQSILREVVQELGEVLQGGAIKHYEYISRGCLIKAPIR